ncbi:hypothetical protein [Umezawaea sp. NPDC059074]|uniref:hypothetical protein n=1 Tax=Umezawaea sp. NPDC059074 TaxID=3346716 RepID=UPI003684E729
MKKTLRALLMGLALAASVIGFAPGAQASTLQAAPAAAVAGGPTIQASWSCNAYFYSNAVQYLPCTVYSGGIKAYINCSNGVRYITPGGNVYLGSGSWNITLVCPSGTVRTGQGFYSIG